MLEKITTPNQSHYVDATSVAAIYAALGDREAALHWLERGYQARAIGMLMLRVSPEFDSLRSDTRFSDMLKRVGEPRS